MHQHHISKYVNFLGIGITPVTYNQVFDMVDEWIKDKTTRSHHIACVNAYCTALALTDARVKKIYNSADITGPDGMPFVYWIRLFTKYKCDRIAAPDTILKLAEHAKITNYTFYLYGGAPDVCLKMKQYLEERFPHINIVGHYSPPFRPLTDEENQQVLDNINSLKPDIICVGLGTPKQDYWIDDNLEKIRGSVLVASGATFDFFGGRIKMAPEFIRKSGLEWVYRLFSKDFKRLWKRYIIRHAMFIGHFFLEITHLKQYPVHRFNRDLQQ